MHGHAGVLLPMKAAQAFCRKGLGSLGRAVAPGTAAAHVRARLRKPSVCRRG